MIETAQIVGYFLLEHDEGDAQSIYGFPINNYVLKMHNLLNVISPGTHKKYVFLVVLFGKDKYGKSKNLILRHTFDSQGRRLEDSSSGGQELKFTEADHLTSLNNLLLKRKKDYVGFNQIENLHWILVSVVYFEKNSDLESLLEKMNKRHYIEKNRGNVEVHPTEGYFIIDIVKKPPKFAIRKSDIRPLVDALKTIPEYVESIGINEFGFPTVTLRKRN